MKCVLLLICIVVLQCGVYSIQRSSLNELKNFKYIRKSIQRRALLNDLDTAATNDDWNYTKHVHSHHHKEEVRRNDL